MPVNVDVHKMAVVEVRRCWNALDGTAGIMLYARVRPTFARTARADERGRALASSAIAGRRKRRVDGIAAAHGAIFARGFTAG